MHNMAWKKKAVLVMGSAGLAILIAACSAYEPKGASSHKQLDEQGEKVTGQNYNPRENFTTAPKEVGDISSANKCMIRVRFGSYCCGPNRETRALLDAYLEKNSTILDVHQVLWGREGEVDYCINPKDAKDRERLTKEIGNLIEQGGQKAGPVGLIK